MGGGSLVEFEPRLDVGPQSVGYRLTRDALVFGGSRLTATDISVAAEVSSIGSPKNTAHLPKPKVADAMSLIRRRIETLIDQTKVVAGDLPVVLVGGGAILVDGELEGASEVIRHRHGNVANAIGAAMAQVSGTVDRVFSLDGVSREVVLAGVVTEAQEKALALGAVPDSLRVIDLEEIPLGEQVHAIRVHAKVIGDLSIDGEDTDDA